MSPRHLYLGLCVLGTALPYSQFIPFLQRHGLSPHEFIAQLFATPVSGFFGWDVIVSSVVLWIFVWIEGRRNGLKHLWAPIAANVAVGVSLGLPLFLYQRELRRQGMGSSHRGGGHRSIGSTREPGVIGVECITPILRVRSLPVSLQYYVTVLGFAIDWGDHAGSEMASVSRDGHSIMLCQGGQGQPGTWIWIGVEDIEPLFEQYRSKGATVRQQPVNRPWAYEMQVEDPDGHVLRFGSEPRTDS